MYLFEAVQRAFSRRFMDPYIGNIGEPLPYLAVDVIQILEGAQREKIVSYAWGWDGTDQNNAHKGSVPWVPPVEMNEVHTKQMAQNTVWNNRKKTESFEKQGIIWKENGNWPPLTGDFGMELNR